MQKLSYKNADGKILNFTSGNYGVNNWSGFSGVGIDVQTQKVPFIDGSIYLDSLLNEREIAITLSYNDEKNLETRYRLRREIITKLNPKLGEGILIYENDFIKKQISVIPNMPVFANKNADEAGTNKADISFIACSPFWEDIEENEEYIDTVTGSGDNARYVGMIENNGDVKASCHIIVNSGAKDLIQIENKKNDDKIIMNTEVNKNYFINTDSGNKTIYSLKLSQTQKSMIYYHIYYSEEADKTLVILCNKGQETQFTRYTYTYNIFNGFDFTYTGENTLNFSSNGDKPYPNAKVYSTTLYGDIYTVAGFNLFKNGQFYSECGNCDFITINGVLYVASISGKLLNVLTLEEVEINGGSIYSLSRAVIHKNNKVIIIEEGDLNDCTYLVIDENYNASSGSFSGTSLTDHIIDANLVNETGKIVVRTSSGNYITDERFNNFISLPFTTDDLNNNPVAKTVMYNEATKMYVLISANVSGVTSGIKVTKDFIHFDGIKVGDNDQYKPNYACCMTQKGNTVKLTSPFYNDGATYDGNYGASGDLVIEKKNEIERLMTNLTFGVETELNCFKANVPFSIALKGKYIGV